MFKKNLAEAFEKFDANHDRSLSRDEFKKFIIARDQYAKEKRDLDMLDQMYSDMDINNDGRISSDEFIDFQFRAFKNYEDNIEFLSRDIKSMDDKIKEVQVKMSQLKERDSGFKINGRPIMKGSTLTFDILDGDFDDQFFDPERFEPMIEITINGTEQVEHTRVIQKPKNMNPAWKEILNFDIHKPTDLVTIQIINNYNNERDMLAEKPFRINEIDLDEDDTIRQLSSQQKHEGKLFISDEEGREIGEFRYQVLWIYNKRIFLEELMANMKEERDNLVSEIKMNDHKLQLIAKPFGAYRNVIQVDDVHFEDAFLPGNVKQFLQVGSFESGMNQKIQLYANRMGFQGTRWGRVAIIAFACWCIATSFVCFQKPDFLNLTLGILGVFMLFDPQQIKQSYLRILVFTLPFSLIYDIVWLIYKSKEYWANTSENGFAQEILVFIYMMFVYKIGLSFILWKASLNFEQFVKQQRELVGLH